MKTKLHKLVIVDGGFNPLCNQNLLIRADEPHWTPYWDDVTCVHCKRIRERVIAGKKPPFGLDRNHVIDGLSRPDEKEPMKKYPFVLKIGGFLLGFEDIGSCPFMSNEMMLKSLKSKAKRVIRLVDGKVIKSRI